MSINKLVLSGIFVMIYTLAMSQIPKGLYTLSAPGSNVSYIQFSKDSFILFSLKRNPKAGDFGLDKMGSGWFSLDHASLVLNFDIQNKKIRPVFLKDSMECSFSTSQSAKTINIFFRLQEETGSVKSTLRVETNNKTFDYILKGDTISLQLPQETLIRSLKFFSIEYDARILPFDNHFNNFRYTYTLKDQHNVVTIIDDKQMEFKILSINKEGYRFKGNASLLKTDEKTVSFLKTVLIQDPQLQKILIL